MTREKKNLFINEHINEAELCQYLLGDYGWDFCLYANGKTGLEQSNSYAVDPADRPIASCACIGLENIDTDFWVRDWTEWDSDTRDWVVLETQEHISLADAIRRCCEEGDVTQELEELREALLEDWEECEKNMTGHFANH